MTVTEFDAARAAYQRNRTTPKPEPVPEETEMAEPTDDEPDDTARVPLDDV